MIPDDAEQQIAAAIDRHRGPGEAAAVLTLIRSWHPDYFPAPPATNT